MNFTSLRYFVHVAEELNISRSAEKLFISQQSLSSHINRLEDELNVKLFLRTPRLSLTYAGICLLRISKQILDLERQIHIQLDDIANERTGSLSIGITRTRARIILPQILPVYSKRYPAVELHTAIGDNQEIYTKLLSGELDLIVSLRPEPNTEVESLPLTTDKICAIVPHVTMLRLYPDSCEAAIRAFSNSQDFSLASFPGEPVLLSSGTHVRRAIDRYFLKNDLHPKIIMETNDIETLFSLCEKGMGITFSFENYAKKFLRPDPEKLMQRSAHIFPINDPELCGHICISYLKKRYLSRAARSFIELSREAIVNGEA